MITVTCACGDRHLCVGTRTSEPTPGLLDTLRAFIDATFEKNPISHVPSAGAYLAYLNWCIERDLVPATQRRFIPAMAELGYPRVKRSTMRLAGLSWKPATPTGRHAAPDRELVMSR